MKLPKPALLLLAFLPFFAEATPFDTGKTLEIELSNDDHVSMDQLNYFTQAVERVFAEHGYAGDYAVGRWSGAAQTNEGPLLHARLIRWATWTPTDFECRFYLTAISHGEKYDLGVFAGRTDALAPTVAQQEARLVDSAARAMEKAYAKLLEVDLIESK